MPADARSNAPEALRITPVESEDAWRAAKALRRRVFIGEQDCPPEEEFDEHDAESRHLLGRMPDGEAVAVARWRAVRLDGGTLNVPALAGMGAAAELAQEHRSEDAARLEALRDRFEKHLKAEIPDVRINGAGTERLPQTANVTFPGVRAETLESELRDLAVSTGSACSTGSKAPSHVLKAMGLTDAQARATLRFSLGRPTTEEEVQFAAERVTEAVGELRSAPVAA